jgi:hypothetical protein
MRNEHGDPVRIEADWNGIEVAIVTEDHPDFWQKDITKHEAMGIYRIHSDWFLIFRGGSPTRRELMEAAGHNSSKIDTAVPQPWLDRNRGLVDKYGGWACWSYEDDSIMGYPIFASELWAKVFARASQYI